MHASTHTHTHTRTHTHAHARTHAQTHTHRRTNEHALAHTHANEHAHAETEANLCSSLGPIATRRRPVCHPPLLRAPPLRARRGLVLGHVTPHQPPPLAIRRDEGGMVVVVRRPIGQPRPPAVGL